MRDLLRERMTNPWWVTRPEPTADDSELTCARRRRDLLAEADQWRDDHEEAR